MSVPSGSRASKIVVTDSVYGDYPVTCRLPISACQASGSGRTCTAYFEAATAVNELEIAAFAPGEKNAISSGSFPEPVGSAGLATASAAIGGSIATVAVIPFLTAPWTGSSPSNRSRLPVGQDESVWIVAENAHHAVIIGSYEPAIALKSTHLAISPSLKTLRNSQQAQDVHVAWSDPLDVPSSALGELAASASGAATAAAKIEPATGIVYFPVGTTSGASVAPGPVALRDGNVYFALNDESGCTAPGSCATLLGEFSTGGRSAKPTIRYVPVKSVPGISSMSFTPDGALWIATFQPVGTWSHALPVLRMSPGRLAVPQPLPSSFTVQGFGFTEDTTGKDLWISGCIGPECLQNHNGKPVLVETSIASPAPLKMVPLSLKCARFGYLGFTVADVALSGGALYVLGLNDGSAPPARGTIWRYVPGAASASCVAPLPSDFNPSPYFAAVPTSGSNDTLVFGAGGNALTFRWPPNHGFYELSHGVLATPSPDITPHVTAVHVSQYRGTVYYVHQNNLGNGVNVSGLGSYEPATKAWNVFPSASFRGAQGQDGVAAVANGAWFSANDVCPGWAGVCLGRARYIADVWGVVPGQKLPALAVGAVAGFAPMNVHSGPGEFDKTNAGAAASVCTLSTPPAKSSATFTVTADGPGVCPITVMDENGNSVPVVVTVTAPRR